MKIKKGDTVEVITGEDRGMKGTVHSVQPKAGTVIVSGVNIVKKHQGPTGNLRTQTGIIELEAPVRLSKVALICPHCNQRSRVGYRVAADGTKSRVCRKCQEVID